LIVKNSNVFLTGGKPGLNWHLCKIVLRVGDTAREHYGFQMERKEGVWTGIRKRQGKMAGIVRLVRRAHLYSG
jgi:hypothetical protein